MDDDEWVERLRRAVANGALEAQAGEPAGGQAIEPPAPPVEAPREPTGVDVAALNRTLRGLERSVRTIESQVESVRDQLQALQDDRDRLIAEIAAAVMARLDARPAPTVDRTWRATAGRWLSG